MSMIAASKMRRAQESALHGRPYADGIKNLLANLAAQPPDDADSLHPLLQRREINNVEIVHITPDRGLTGGLNANVNRAGGEYVASENAHVKVIAAGRKGRDFMVRMGVDVRAVFTDMADRPTITDISAIARLVIDDYTDGVVDAVYLVYAKFVSTTVQQPQVEPLLPVVPAELSPQEAVGYIYEPESASVLSALLPRFVEIEIYHAVLESIASEHSARMVAMRNATDNATEMVGDLTLVMNKARQESITTELLDIIGGAAAVEG